MPTNKDFKRLVRGRMRKTGESYTTARMHLLQQASSTPPASVPESRAQTSPAKLSPADYAEIAGTSDETLKEKTGCTWVRWVTALDHVEAHTWTHREIAQYVHEKYKVSGWWAQRVTVGYERIRGLREKGQRRGGAYEATKSKTVPVPVRRLYRAFKDKRTRERWLPDAKLTIRTAQPDRSMRISWGDGTAVDLWFTRKGDAKAQVQVQHRKLPSKEAATQMKQYWEDRLGALVEVLTRAKERTR